MVCSALCPHSRIGASRDVNRSLLLMLLFVASPVATRRAALLWVLWPKRLIDDARAHAIGSG